MSGRVTPDLRHAPGWFAVPHASNPRWLLPRDSRRVAAASLGIFQPLTVKGRIGWEAARVLSSLGLFRVLPNRAAPPRQVRDLVDPYIPVGGSIALARTNHVGRSVVLILAPDGAAVAAAKVATDVEGRNALAREANNLEQFGRLLTFPISAPRILGRAEAVLVVEAIHWQPRWRPWQMSEDVAFALGAFFRAEPGPVVNGTRTGLSHGDVAPWNLLRTHDRWVLIDWEDAQGGRPPFYDLMHFLAQSCTLLGKPTPQQLAEGVAQLKWWIGRAVTAYARGAEMAPDEAWQHLVTYLRDNIDDSDRRRLLEKLTRT